MWRRYGTINVRLKCPHCNEKGSSENVEEYSYRDCTLMFCNRCGKLYRVEYETIHEDTTCHDCNTLMIKIYEDYTTEAKYNLYICSKCRKTREIRQKYTRTVKLIKEEE